MKHTFRKCLSIVLALATLFSVCVLPLSAAPTASDPKCNHYAYITEANYVRTQAATCTVEGGKIYNCPKCGENFVHKDTWQKPLDHDWVWNEEDSTAPTGYAASEKGTKVWECSRCDATKTTDWYMGCEGPHTVVTGVDSATCAAGGTRTDTCENCSWTQTVTTPALGHVWNDGVITTRPVCGEQNGVITFTCTRAGCDVDAATEGAQAGTYEVVEIAAVNHEWKWYAYNAGECGVNGNQEGYKCAQCDAWSKDGVTLETGSFVIVNNPHVWAKCTNADHAHEGALSAELDDGCHAGTIYKYCTNAGCGKCQAFEFDPAVEGNHQVRLDGGSKIVSATLTRVAGPDCKFGATYQCGKCGTTFKSEVFDEDKPAHDWANGAYVEATCTSYGYKSCARCGATEGYVDMQGNIINPDFNKLNHLPKALKGVLPTGEAFTALMTELGATYHPATCAKAAYYEYYCPNAGCDHSIAGTAGMYQLSVGTPNPHSPVIVDPVAPTCTTTGIKGGIYCANCDTYGVKTPAAANEVIPKLNHTWENEAVGATDTASSIRGWVEANCMYAAHEGELCGRCKLENLDQSKMDFTKNPTGQADPTKHDWDNSKTALVTPPTCTTTGSERKYCRICNQEYEAEVSALKHDWQNDPTIQPVGTVPATCHNDGYYVYYCSVCKVTSKGETFKLANNMRDRFESHYEFTGHPTKDYTYNPNPATGIPVFVLTPKSHDAIVDITDPATLRAYENLIGADDATTPYLDGYDITNNIGSCGVRSYYEWECAHCNYNYNKLVEDKFGATGTHLRIDDPNAPVMNCITNTPGVEGKEICERCATVLATGTEVPVRHTIDETMDGYIGLTAATCLNPGFDEYGVCTKCTAAYATDSTSVLGEMETTVVGGVTLVYRWNNKVVALGHAAGTLVAKRAADCLLPGYDAHYLCVRECGYVLNNAGIDFEAEDWEDALTSANWVTEAAMIASAGTATVINNYVKELGHDFNTPSNLIPMLCKQDGYTWYDCGREGCTNAVKVVSFKFGYVDHRYSDLSKVTDVKCLESYCLCQNNVEYVITNETTGAETAGTEKCLNKNVLRAADAHKNAAGLVIDLSDCLFYDDVEDHKCATCEETFTIDEYDHKGEATHKLVAANCQNYSYELWACERCAQGWIANKGNTLGGHDYQIPLSDGYVAPTWTTTGYRKMQCLYCDDVNETILKAADVFFEMDIANKFGGTVLVNGGMMAVTVKMTAPGTAIYSVRMGVKFNPDVLEWVPSTETITNVFGANVTEVWCDNNTMDSVMIYAHAEKDAAGKMQNINLKGTETLVTLYFQINPEFYDLNTLKNAFEVSSIDFDDITVTTYDATASTKVNYVAGDEFVEINYDASATATDADPIKVETQIYGSGIPEVKPNQALNGSNDKGAYKLVIYKLGDLNKDGVVGTVDAGMFYEIIVKAGAYNAQADLDKNGVLEMADFLMMKQLMVNKLTYAEVAKR